MRSVLKGVGRFAKSVGSFFAALGSGKSKQTAPDPRKVAARKAREYMHADRIATSGRTGPEKFYAKELAKAYKKPSER